MMKKNDRIKRKTFDMHIFKILKFQKLQWIQQLILKSFGVSKKIFKSKWSFFK